MTMGRLFGTDGARGVAITELTCEMAMQIGRAAALVLTKETKHRAKIFIGKDTRISSDILEAALCAGICSVGAEAVQLGVVPTPAVAYLVRTKGADAGVMISASHNSVEFNGIKLFASTGYKLPDATEAEVEALILDHPEQIQLQSGTAVGAISIYDSAREDYISYLASCVHTDCSGMRVVLDCANGSSSTTAESLFTRLGAEVHMLSASPDGTNINKNCGSTHMENLMEYVKTHDCDLGLAFDGDADRCLAVDENGVLVDGDKIIAICAKALQQEGKLKNDTAVVTVMTNLGFVHAMREAGIEVLQTKVGDRYVLEAMREGGYVLGGEQSGHMILLEHNSTGDGLMTACQFLAAVRRSEKPVEEAIKVMVRFPQTLINVRVKDKHALDGNEAIWGAVRTAEEAMGDSGRVLVRTSGTEPLVRVMVEAETQDVADAHARTIADVVEAQLA